MPLLQQDHNRGGMANPAEQHSLLQKPLYVFDLPEEILYTLQLRTQPSNERDIVQAEQTSTSSPPTPADREDAAPASATSCALCALTFPSLLEQRSHVRSDLHAYNLKQKLRGNAPVSEIDFERLVTELDESLSGSDSSSESEDDGAGDVGNASKPKDSTLSALLKKQAKLNGGDTDDAPTKAIQRGQGRPPLLWFSSSKLPPNTSLGIYRAIFTQAEQAQESQLVKIIQQKQLTPKPPPSIQKSKKPVGDEDEDGGVPLPANMIQSNTRADGPHYFLCMIGGGHFAAMLVSLTPRLTRKAGTDDRSATVIASKTFHRYTTRRKQGGSQSANDNAKGNAHSAGSSLRRYNESALTDEVRALLSEWRSMIDSSELLFIRATGTTNRRTLFGPYEGHVLDSRDPRVRGFPFNTRRATQSELMRAFVELTRVKISAVDEVARAREAEEAAAAVAASKAEALANSKSSAAKSNKPTPQEEEAALHTAQLQALIRRSKAPGMLSYIQNNRLDPNFLFFPPPQHHHSPTPLHLAAASNSPACVSALLLKAKADPTIRNGEGKTAFEIAGDRPTRDAFRLARTSLGEYEWQWDAAGVPAGLTQADADARTAREKEEKAAEEATEKQRRQAETERLRQADAERAAAGHEKKFGRGHVLEKPKMTAEERRMEEARGMSDEMRMRLEREKRARAAEERLKRLQGK